jgi:hypothetical protein
MERVIHFLMTELTIEFLPNALADFSGHFCSKKSGSKTNKINIVARNVSMMGGCFAVYFSTLGRGQLPRRR